MIFGKKKRTEEILRLEIDVLWKCFLILNGIFLIAISQVIKIDSIKSFWDILMIILVFIYFFATIWMIWVMTKKYKDLFKILEK